MSQQKIIALAEKLLSPPLTTRLYQAKPSLLRSLIPAQKKLNKAAPNPNELLWFCRSLLDACTEALAEGDRNHLAWCGELVMLAGALPGFPEASIILYSRRLSKLDIPISAVVSADNPSLTLKQIKSIDDRPEAVVGFSRSLNRNIVVVGREKMIDQARQDHPGLPIYIACECLILKDLTPDMRIAVAQAKEIFDGVISAPLSTEGVAV